MRRQTVLGGETLAGSGCHARLDPLALPVRFTAQDAVADGQVRQVELDHARMRVRRSVRGMTLIAIGVALNVLVIALNQGMPTKDDVRERAGREVRVPIEQTVKHRPQEDDDLVGFLGDVITVPGFPNQQFSIGDIVWLEEHRPISKLKRWTVVRGEKRARV